MTYAHNLRRFAPAATATLLLLLLPILEGCAVNTVTDGPIQSPVEAPRTKRGRDTPEPPPTRDRTPPPVVEAPAPAAPAADPAVVPEETPTAATPAAPQNADTALLLPTLWTQTAVEYRGLTRQAYRLARINLEAALADGRWSAWVASPSDEASAASPKPPAIVLDVDETVLDNSPYEARRVLDGAPFSKDSWFRWCRESAAEPVPGALEFTRYAESRGVAVFYVTNRDAEVEDATRKNLEKWGFPLGPPGEDRLLTRGEQDGWGSEKESRRRWIAESHRILLLVGDDFGDFIAGARAGRPERDALFDAYRDRWGEEWILLPNPSYGSWERAIVGRPAPEADGALKLKLEALDPHR